MCDALSKLKPENTEDVTVETSVYYAEALTQTVSPPKVFTLDNSHFLFIDEISKRYKDCTLVEDVTLKRDYKNAVQISNPLVEMKKKILFAF